MAPYADGDEYTVQYVTYESTLVRDADGGEVGQIGLLVEQILDGAKEPAGGVAGALGHLGLVVSDVSATLELNIAILI